MFEEECGDSDLEKKERFRRRRVAIKLLVDLYEHGLYDSVEVRDPF